MGIACGRRRDSDAVGVVIGSNDRQLGDVVGWFGLIMRRVKLRMFR